MSDKTILDQQWLDTANEVPQETVDTEQQGYPYLQWASGNRLLKAVGGVPYTGGWALPSANIDAEQIPGWTRGELTHGNGSTDVWFCQNVTVAMIRSRKAWVTNDGQTNQFWAWNQYNAAKAAGKPRGKLQILAYVKGLEAHGVFMLTLRGSFARAVTETIIPALAKYVLGPANQVNAKRGVKSKFPSRAFWVTIGPQRELDGGPHFVEVGVKPNSSLVVLPMAIGLSDKLTMADIGKLFVGKELLATGTLDYTEAEQWATALEAAGEAGAQPVAAAAGADAGGESEIPF
jgi:hypothetical protein